MAIQNCALVAKEKSASPAVKVPRLTFALKQSHKVGNHLRGWIAERDFADSHPRIHCHVARGVLDPAVRR
jgi:hypothetical protein